MSDSADASSNRGLSVALVMAYAAIAALRAPRIWTEGRFWAEEATVYFHYAWQHSTLDSILAPHLGYYSLVANLSTWLAASTVSLLHAPLVTSLFALSIQVLPAALIVGGGLFRRRGDQLLAVCLLLFVAPSQEVWLNTINSQFHLCVAAGLLLASPTGRGPRGWLEAAVLVLAGATGVVSAFLAPLFWVAAVRERSRPRFLQAALLSACAAIQLALVASAPGHPERELSLDVLSLALATLTKGVLTPLLGLAGARNLAEPLRAGAAGGSLVTATLAVAILAAAAWAAWRLRAAPSATRRLLTASALVWGLSFATSLGPDKAQLIDPFENHRYFFAPLVLAALGLLCLGRDRADDRATASDAMAIVRRRALVALLAWTCLTGASSYPRPGSILQGPSWPVEVARWHGEPAHALAVWPRGWRFRLPPHAAR